MKQGAHVMSTMEAGKVFYKEGYVQTGRANDAIVAGSNFVTTAQTVVSRRLNPFETGVVTIGSFDGKVNSM